MSEHLNSHADMTHLYRRLEDQRKQHDIVWLSDEEEQLLRQAVDRGDPEAMLWLGLYYTVSDRGREGLGYVTRAAEAGSPAAIGAKATIEFWRRASPGAETRVDDDVFAGWLTAAEAGDYQAQFMLAQHGDEAREPLSETRCLELLMAAANAGYCSAIDTLADHYYRGIWVEQDLARAASLSRQSLDMAALSSSQAIVLAAFSAEGHGVPKSAAECVHYLHLHAAWHSRGGPIDYPDALGYACGQLAELYLREFVINQSREERLSKGVFWYALAAYISNKQAREVLPLLIQLAQRLSSGTSDADFGHGIQTQVVKAIQTSASTSSKSPDWANNLATAEDVVTEMLNE